VTDDLILRPPFHYRLVFTLRVSARPLWFERVSEATATQARLDFTEQNEDVGRYMNTRGDELNVILEDVTSLNITRIQ